MSSITVGRQVLSTQILPNAHCTGVVCVPTLLIESTYTCTYVCCTVYIVLFFYLLPFPHSLYCTINRAKTNFSWKNYTLVFFTLKYNFFKKNKFLLYFLMQNLIFFNAESYADSKSEEKNRKECSKAVFLQNLFFYNYFLYICTVLPVVESTIAKICDPELPWVIIIFVNGGFHHRE